MAPFHYQLGRATGEFLGGFQSTANLRSNPSSSAAAASSTVSGSSQSSLSDLLASLRSSAQPTTSHNATSSTASASSSSSTTSHISTSTTTNSSTYRPKPLAEADLQITCALTKAEIYHFYNSRRFSAIWDEFKNNKSDSIGITKKTLKLLFFHHLDHGQSVSYIAAQPDTYGWNRRDHLLRLLLRLWHECYLNPDGYFYGKRFPGCVGERAQKDRMFDAFYALYDFYNTRIPQHKGSPSGRHSTGSSMIRKRQHIKTEHRLLSNRVKADEQDEQDETQVYIKTEPIEGSRVITINNHSGNVEVYTR